METLSDNTTLLEVRDFSLSFRHYKKGLHETNMQVIRNLTMTIHKGEIVAIVGASGSGKSLLANAILGILPNHAIQKGTLNYKGSPLTRKRQVQLRGREISLIPQSVNALDPLMKVAKQVQAVIRDGNKQAIQEGIFQELGLPIEAGDKYPFELSGGMARRVLAAIAMLIDAELIIADEPTPGLDPEVLHETVTLIKELGRDGKGVMFITHDIETALKIADKVAVFNKGKIVEIADVQDFSGRGKKLKHPYTRTLWNALPANDFIVQEWEKSEPLQTGILEIKGMSYQYQSGPTLFKELTFSLRPGEIVGLHGYSGSGKTTMAEIIAGYVKAEQGYVKIDGKSNFTQGRHPVQLIWQHPEKAFNPRWQMKKVLAESDMLDHALLEELGIKQEWLTRYPSELSGGELQRFSVARVFHEDTKYIIADEITTMLDAITQATLWKIMMRHARTRNVGILAISHDQQLLNKVCDRIINFKEISNV